MVWKSAGDNMPRNYDFIFDDVNRLTEANFYEFTSGYFNKFSGIDFTVNGLKYDPNGNILAMRQMGWKQNASSYIDQLAYAYQANSNKLARVTDTIVEPTTKLGDFKDGTNTGTDDYTYNVNGNLTRDNNKNITSILYTHQNLPYEIRMAGKGMIAYVYDNLETKWKKITVDSTVTPLKRDTVLYMRNFVYDSDTLQFFTHEEGRARYDTTQTTSEATAFDYDYFLKDHLGNIRMVLTPEKDTAKYTPLTFEGTAATAQVINQDVIWEKKTGASIDVVGSRTARPGSFGTAGSNGSYVVLARKSTGAIGAAKLLKVMAGDRIHATVDYYYATINANNTGAGGINSLTANIAAAIGASGQVSGALKDGAAGIASGLSGVTALVNLLNTANNTSGANNAPKAYLNIIAFDDQFKYDPAGSAVKAVPYNPNMGDVLSFLTSSAVTMKKNGYVYVFCSNESDELVYFDNFTLSHEKGPILEDTHYYPFGLTMAGISSRALLKTENKYKFNDGTELASKEFSDGAGLDWYETSFRSYDPQIGRFHQIDPLAEIDDQFSPYAFGNNNPISFNDPLGLRPINLNKTSNPDVNSGGGGGGGGSSWFADPYNREPTFKSYFEPSLNDAVNAAYHSPNGGEVTRNDQGRWGTNLYTAYEADQFVEYYKTTKEYKENRKSERTKLDDPTYGADYLEKVYVTAPEKELADPGNPMKTAMAVAIGLSIADGPLPIGEIIGGVIVLGTYTYVYWDDISNGWDRLFAKEHTKDARSSTKGKHEKGRSRAQQDREGSKGMKNPPRLRPPGWKGSWPPK